MQPKSIKSANGMHSEKIKNFSCIPKVKNAQRDDFETELKEKYVSHPVRSLAQVYVYRDQCQPFGIYNDEDEVELSFNISEETCK